jgi:hypothetical protein
MVTSECSTCALFSLLVHVAAKLPSFSLTTIHAPREASLGRLTNAAVDRQAMAIEELSQWDRRARWRAGLARGTLSTRWPGYVRGLKPRGGTSAR